MMLYMFLLLWITAVGQLQGKEERDHPVALYLLNILPYPDPRPNSGWDAAHELIPAAELAVEQINHLGILPENYKLNVVNVDSEACGIPSVSKGIINTLENLFYQKFSHVVGLVGLFCSTVTEIISKIFSVNKMAFLQLSGSTAIALRNTTEYPWLHHFVPSSASLNKAVLALMREFGWEKMGVVFNSVSIFHKSNAKDLTSSRLANLTEFNLTAFIPITDTTSVDFIFDMLHSPIVYLSGTLSEVDRIMCEVYKRQNLYPDYVFILIEKTQSELVQRASTSECTAEQITLFSSALSVVVAVLLAP